MKSDLDKHIEKHLKDKEFKMYFDRAEAKRKIAQEIVFLRKAQHISQAQLARDQHQPAGYSSAKSTDKRVKS
jgi:hypothetical protein